MKLQDYLSQTKTSPEDFAKKVEASTSGVRKWVSGERIPRPKHVRRITEATKGAVTAIDLIGGTS